VSFAIPLGCSAIGLRCSPPRRIYTEIRAGANAGMVRQRAPASTARAFRRTSAVCQRTSLGDDQHIQGRNALPLGRGPISGLTSGRYYNQGSLWQLKDIAIIGGPNGAGKTTTAPAVVRRKLGIRECSTCDGAISSPF
jgi:hypothetical protein